MASIFILEGMSSLMFRNLNYKIMDILILITTAVLGIFLGAQIAEALLIVPYWKSLTANQFYTFYKRYGDDIHRFFAPLTIGATILPILLFGIGIQTSDKRLDLLIALICCVALFFSTYFVFFKKANERFKTEDIEPSQLPKALKIWGRWHWLRICFECLAFLILLIL